MAGRRAPTCHAPLALLRNYIVCTMHYASVSAFCHLAHACPVALWTLLPSATRSSRKTSSRDRRSCARTAASYWCGAWAVSAEACGVEWCMQRAYRNEVAMQPCAQRCAGSLPVVPRPLASCAAQEVVSTDPAAGTVRVRCMNSATLGWVTGPSRALPAHRPSLFPRSVSSEPRSRAQCPRACAQPPVASALPAHAVHSCAASART
jgi:hypothetical protein